MNWKQAVAVLVAVGAVALAFRYPPYWDDGVVFGGTVYYLAGHPPADAYGISYNDWLLRRELSYAALTLAAALVALRTRGPRGQRVALGVGLCLELAFFASQVPQFNTVLTPELTWYGLNLMATVLLAVMCVVECKSRRARQHQQPEAHPTPRKEPQP